MPLCDSGESDVLQGLLASQAGSLLDVQKSLRKQERQEYGGWCSKQLTHLCHADSWVAGADVEVLYHFVHFALTFPNLQEPQRRFIASNIGGR